MQPQISRPAGLGVFIVNTQPGASSTIYIKASLRDCSSVLMAEAAALALGALCTCSTSTFLPVGQLATRKLLQLEGSCQSTSLGHQAFYSELHQQYQETMQRFSRLTGS